MSVAPQLLRILSLWSLKIQYWISDIFCFLVSAFPNRTSTLTRKNVHLCFPDLSQSQQKQLCKLTVRHTCYSMFELAAVWCWPVQKILNRVKKESVCQAFRNSNKGRIVIVPHLGSWELTNLWLAQEGNYMALYKPPANKALNDFILNARSRNGAQMLPIDTSGLRKLSRGLKQGKTVMILPDQRPRRSRAGAISNFFGHNARTTTLIHNLCSKIDCDVFIATMFRERYNASFNLSIEPLDHETLASDQQQSLDYMNGEIADLIMKNPEQYQWGYGRFPRSEYQLEE